MKEIRIVTRASKLALWQANFVANKLKTAGHSSKIITMDTIGDKILDVTIAKIGSKGVFTEELEVALEQGEADIAVHSAKDMQSMLPEGFHLIAFSEREEMHDVLVSHLPALNLDKPLLVGTSSTRRTALFKHFYPQITTVAIRGNLQTRIRKMEEGECDALMLAYAGVHRMGYGNLIRLNMPVTEFTPPVGQGCITIEAHKRLDEEVTKAVYDAVNHSETSICLKAERAFLRTLEGGCSIPAFGLATLKKKKELYMEAGIVSLDGKQLIRKNISGDPENAAVLGATLAKIVLEAGGKEILQEIKQTNEA